MKIDSYTKIGVKMINQISGFVEGEIYELGGNSEPLYIWHFGKLIEITPREYNICTVTLPENRWAKIFDNRFTNQHGV